MELGEALYVGLVDDGLVPGPVRRAVVSPVKEAVDNDTEWDGAGIVLVVKGQVCLGVANFVAEDGRLPVEMTAEGAGVGVAEELVGVEAQALAGFVGTVSAI